MPNVVRKRISGELYNYGTLSVLKRRAPSYEGLQFPLDVAIGTCAVGVGNDRHLARSVRVSPSYAR